jgi:hypothetical protein
MESTFGSNKKKCVFCCDISATYSNLYTHEPICLAERAKKLQPPISSERTIALTSLEFYLQHDISVALANDRLSGELFHYVRLSGTCRSLRRACENLLLGSQHAWEVACRRLERSQLSMRKMYTGKLVPIYDAKNLIMSCGDWRTAFVTEIQSLRRFGYSLEKLEFYLRRDPAEGQLDSDMNLVCSERIQPREFYTRHAWRMDFGKSFAHVKRMVLNVTIMLLDEGSRALYREDYCAGQTMRWYEYNKRAEGMWNVTETGVELSLTMTEDTEMTDRPRSDTGKKWTLFIPALKFSHLPEWPSDDGTFGRLTYRPMFLYDGEEPYDYDLLS